MRLTDPNPVLRSWREENEEIRPTSNCGRAYLDIKSAGRIPIGSHVERKADEIVSAKSGRMAGIASRLLFVPSSSLDSAPLTLQGHEKNQLFGLWLSSSLIRGCPPGFF